MRQPLLGLLFITVGCRPADATTSDGADLPPPIAAGARASLGTPAPDFVLPSVSGELVRLSDYEGKVVVLEWFNPGCPFVKEVYNTDKMTDLAGRWAEEDVAWIAINSGAPGKQGTGQRANSRAASSWDIRYPILLDESGAVGRAYDARTTPHMYVIDASGNLAFAGAFSNAPLGDVSDGAEEVNYVDAALRAVTTGQPVAETAPRAWGCSVKYGS